jgi:hypothetical protein
VVRGIGRSADAGATFIQAAGAQADAADTEEARRVVEAGIAAVARPGRPLLTATAVRACWSRASQVWGRYPQRPSGEIPHGPAAESSGKAQR